MINRILIHTKAKTFQEGENVNILTSNGNSQEISKGFLVERVLDRRGEEEFQPVGAS